MKKTTNALFPPSYQPVDPFCLGVTSACHLPIGTNPSGRPVMEEATGPKPPEPGTAHGQWPKSGKKSPGK